VDEFTALIAVIVGPPFSVCASSADGTLAGIARGVKSRTDSVRRPSNRFDAVRRLQMDAARHRDREGFRCVAPFGSP